jgi:flagellar basal body-associated protein FliL
MLPTPPQSEPESRRGRPRPIQILLAAVAVLALVAGGVAGFRLVSSGLNNLTAPAMNPPATRVTTLSPGRYTLYQRTGTQSGGGGITFSENGPADLTPSDVQVTGPDGEVPTEADPDNETLDRNGAVYTGALSFQVVTHGQYQVHVSGPPTQVVLARALFDGMATNIAVLVISIVVFALAVGALVITMIVSAVRRGRQRRTGPPPGPPGPPGPAGSPVSWAPPPPLAPASWAPPPPPPGYAYPPPPG